MANKEWVLYFRYTAWSVVMAIVVLPVVVSYFASSGDANLRPVVSAHPAATAVLIAQVVLACWSSWRTLRRWAAAGPGTGAGRPRRLGTLRPDASLALALAPAVGVIALAGPAPGGELLVLQSASLALASVTMVFPSAVGVAGGVALFVVAGALGWPPDAGAPTAFVHVAVVLTIRTTVWLAAVVRELEVARADQARLSVAEERLRFARDLHDVAGRDLSTIAVTSEMVATLVERGDPRALESSREVAQIARASLSELRGLVRGYREADLAAELRGTVSLLRSAHAEVTTLGSTDDVPAEHAGMAAWVLREGGTNILRHAEARQVTITLEPSGLTLRNDGVAPGHGGEEGAGLQGLRERLGDTATLTTVLDGDTFTLDVRFRPAPDAPHSEAPAAAPAEEASRD